MVVMKDVYTCHENVPRGWGDELRATKLGDLGVSAEDERLLFLLPVVFFQSNRRYRRLVPQNIPRLVAFAIEVV